MATLAMHNLDVFPARARAKDSWPFPAGPAPCHYLHDFPDSEPTALLPAEPKTSILPFGFPEVIVSERVWSATDFRDESRFIVPLNGIEIREIENGLKRFKEKCQSLDQVSRESFPLPSLSAKLKSIAHQLHLGLGCILLRGLDPKKYTSTDNLLIYFGITSHIAEDRGRQDSDGNMLIHIKDYRLGEKRQVPYSNETMTFHNDKCAILAMYTISRAAEGGESLIASSGQIYNAIASSRPDLISVLAEPSWPFQESADPYKWALRPLLFDFPDQGPAFCFNSRHIICNGIGAATNEAPALSTKQAEALALVEKTARENAYSVELRSGDIQLLNNFSILHARAAFQDRVGDSERHLVRLWLKNPELAWNEPENLGSNTWTAYTQLRDDGSEIERRWPLVAGSFTSERIARQHEGCS